MSDDPTQPDYPYPIGKPFTRQDGTTWQKFQVAWRRTSCSLVEPLTKRKQPETTRMAHKVYTDEPPF